MGRSARDIPLSLPEGLQDLLLLATPTASRSGARPGVVAEDAVSGRASLAKLGRQVAVAWGREGRRARECRLYRLHSHLRGEKEVLKLPNGIFTDNIK